DWAASEGGFNLPKTLKDIFIELARKINWNQEKVHQLNVPGFLHSGAVLMKVNLDCPKGYACRYVTHEACEVLAD
ncbi:6514_t:CDS:2, partial [Entrophospora sp. SA101]